MAATRVPISITSSESGAALPPGVRNLGCTCYLSCIIQMLFATRSLRERLLAVPHIPADTPQLQILRELQSLFSRMQSVMDLGSSGSVDPDGLFEALRAYDGRCAFSMEDAGEFLLRLLDVLEPALEAVGLPDVLAECLGGTTVSQTIPVCNHKPAAREEQELVFDVPVSDGSTLPELLEKHIAGGYELEGDECFECDSCKKRVRAKRTAGMHALADTVVLSFKRFEYDRTTHRMMKVAKKVEFPEHLSLGPFSAVRCSGRPAPEERRNPWAHQGGRDMAPPDEYYQYRLRGVVVHLGSTMDSGHYYALLRQDRQQGPPVWLRLDDSSVTELDQDLAAAAFGADSNMSSPWTPTAYQLWYERSSCSFPVSPLKPETLPATQQAENAPGASSFPSPSASPLLRTEDLSKSTSPPLALPAENPKTPIDRKGKVELVNIVTPSPMVDRQVMPEAQHLITLPCKAAETPRPARRTNAGQRKKTRTTNKSTSKLVTSEEQLFKAGTPPDCNVALISSPLSTSKATYGRQGQASRSW